MHQLEAKIGLSDSRCARRAQQTRLHTPPAQRASVLLHSDRRKRRANLLLSTPRANDVARRLAMRVRHSKSQDSRECPSARLPEVYLRSRDERNSR